MGCQLQDLHPQITSFSPPLYGHLIIHHINVQAFKIPIATFFPFLETYAPILTRLDTNAMFPARDIDARVPTAEELPACILLSMAHLV